MRRSTCGRNNRGMDALCEDDDVGLGKFSLKKYIGAAFGLPIALPVVATAAAVAAPAVALAPVIAPTLAAGAAVAPDEIKNLGEKFNIGDSSDDWKKWAESFAAVATVGLSRDKNVREAVKDLGEKWNVGNNSVDTLKSMLNVASIAATLTGVGTMASALLGSSSLTQGAMTAAREYARETIKDRVVGKVGEELADPYVDHLIRKARRDAAQLDAEERALVAQYQAQRPGVYSLMMMTVENPNALTQEQMQVIVNYQRDLENERAEREGLPDPVDDDWFNYYARFLGEYGVAWNPTENPGVTLQSGDGLPVRGIPVPWGTPADMSEQYAALGKSPRSSGGLQFSPELSSALRNLYPS